jgi:hypothetical protein
MGESRRSALIGSVLAVTVALAGGQRDAGAGIAGATRILVAPASARGGAAEEPITRAAAALLAEVLPRSGRACSALIHDLSKESLEALDFEPGKAPSTRRLTRSAMLDRLRDSDHVRILILPGISPAAVQEGDGLEVELRWMDLVSGDEGIVTESAPAGAPVIDLLARLAVQAQAGWRSGWPEGGPAPAPRIPGSELSSSPEALARWAAAGERWKTGRVPAAIRELGEAIGTDEGFGRAKVELAWIRLAQGRRDEAGALAGAAVEGGRLSPEAIEEATIIRIFAAGDAGAAATLAESLEEEQPPSWRAALARATADLLGDSYAPSISHLDLVRAHRPNDPAIQHLAGMAGLGAEDYYEARIRLARAAELWPEHETIRLDQAETEVRAHDLEAAAGILESWAAGWSPSDPPSSTAAWSIGNAPPPVRARAVDLLMGHLSASARALGERAAALAIAGADGQVRVPMLHALHELQMLLSSLGTDREKQQWLDGARSSLREIEDLLAGREAASASRELRRLTALLRVREGRLDEARAVREEIMGESEMPGYDPAIEAEIDYAITLKEARSKEHFEACRRLVKARGLLSDHYKLAQANAIVRDWRSLELEYDAISDRLENWSMWRREDSLTWGPIASGHVPFIYYVGGLARMNQGDSAGAKERFGSFLAYFKRPDPVFSMFRADAAERGAKAAW